MKLTSGRGSALASIDALGQEVLVYIGLGMTWPYGRELASTVAFTMTTSFQSGAVQNERPDVANHVGPSW